MNKAVLLILSLQLLTLTNFTQTIYKKQRPKTEIEKQADIAIGYLSRKYSEFSTTPKIWVDGSMAEVASAEHLPDAACEAIIHSLSPKSQEAVHNIHAAGYYPIVLIGEPKDGASATAVSAKSQAEVKESVPLGYLSERYKNFGRMPRILVDDLSKEEGTSHFSDAACTGVMNSLSPRSQQALCDTYAAGYYPLFLLTDPKDHTVITATAGAGVQATK